MRETRNLRVWHNAREFVSSVYRASREFPTEERFGLTSQLRRATVSIVANISEGAGRGSDRELARFLRIALGSAAEVETLLIVASDLGILDLEVLEALNSDLDGIRRMTTRLLQVVASAPEARS